MNAERLLALYDYVADAPDAVSRLRRFVLDLAVRGKLVEQDPADEPASKLLKRIAAEKERLVKAGVIRKKRQLPENSAPVVPFEIPESWALILLGEAVVLINGRAFKPTDWSGKGLPIVRIQNLNNPSAPFNRFDGELKEKFLIDDGDFLISWSGTPGTSFGAYIWDRGPAILNQHIFKSILPEDVFDKKFLKVAINARLLELIKRAHGGVGLQHITKPKLEALTITLPSLAEQRRVVAKVDELMALCDRLEAARTAREKIRNQLTKASYARLSVPDTHAVTFRSDARFAINAFPALTARANQVKQLRQTILNLAVRGRLVEQDPADEPASKLLKRIAAEKERLVKAGEIRKRRDLSNGEAVDPPFDLPATWQWCRLDTVGAIIGGGTPSSADKANFSEPGKGIPWVTPADLGGYNELYIKNGSRDLTEKGLQSSSATMMPARTVLFTSRAPIGYVAIAANPIATNQGFKSIVPYIPDCSRFIALAMRTFAHKIDASAPGTTFKEASGKIVAGVPFPLPPLAEQHRIVAKIDELISLCDRLEASLDAIDTGRNRLLESLLRDALKSAANEPEAGHSSTVPIGRDLFLPRNKRHLQGA